MQYTHGEFQIWLLQRAHPQRQRLRRNRGRCIPAFLQLNAGVSLRCRVVRRRCSLRADPMQCGCTTLHRSPNCGAMNHTTMRASMGTCAGRRRHHVAVLVAKNARTWNKKLQAVIHPQIGQLVHGSLRSRLPPPLSGSLLRKSHRSSGGGWLS